MHYNMKKAKFRRMSIISNSFDVRTSQRVKSNKHLDEDRKKDKQLLTPNIKRFLKTWLLDHKEYPYPDRYEKIMLAQETGLTIMQVNTSTQAIKNITRDGTHPVQALPLSGSC
uniref:Homeobox protein Meis3 n=1 Tax=Cacopsylla melanoneura TaxID=428564 RepID=A0A8D8XKI7_9HEMI